VKAINAYVVIFPFRARLLNCSRLALAPAEFLGPQEVALLVPHRAFPFAGLLQMFCSQVIFSLCALS
jgi:hypothetical protein